ncbi:MAG TPA: elongation factor G [Tissierellia bacterium]|nr:elongation factor G [Tissierellia bacterium]
MKTYPKDKIRNVVLLGHGNSGKTTLMESILFNLGETGRMGKVEEGNTVSDFTKEEINRKFSLSTSLIPVEWRDHKINFLDTPGYFDFVGDAFSALRVAGGAVIVIDAGSGIEVGTEKAWGYTQKRNLPRIIFINKMDKENINYVNLIRNLKDKFGKKIAPFVLPMGDGEDFEGFVNVVDMVGRKYNGTVCEDVAIPDELTAKIDPLRDMLIESVAESDEELMEKYFEGEEFTKEEIQQGLRAGVLEGDVVPVIVGAAGKSIGVHTLMNMIIDYLPMPADTGTVEGFKPGEEETKVVRDVDKDAPFSALVFKTMIDPFVGKISLFRVMSGTMKSGMEVLNVNKDQTEKIGNLFIVRGKKQMEVSEITAGDIGAVTKLSVTQSGDTLSDKANPIQYPGIKFPKPGLFKAIEPKAKGDEEKIGSSLTRLNEEDPSFSVTRNSETGQLLLGAQGTMQLAVIANKLKDMFDVEVEVIPQKIAYRETIKGEATVQGRHKKQSGGAGQFGDVHIKFEPNADGFVFEEKVFGGSVPKAYFPAVQKGLEESLLHGPLAGYPVVNMKATLLDGSYHSVDSSEMAFKIAASLAFKLGMPKANPILLEPIMHLEITVPDENMGDIMGDMNKRRGRILGMEPDEDGYQKVLAEAPEAELFSYSSDLRSMTQARGYFSVRFERYEEVPGQIASKIIAEAQEEDK